MKPWSSGGPADTPPCATALATIASTSDRLDAENADRAALYGEVLTANGLEQERIVVIERSFANSFQAESPSGTWVQDRDGKWARKP